MALDFRKIILSKFFMQSLRNFMFKFGKFYPLKAIWNFLFFNSYFFLKRKLDAFEIELIKQHIKEGNTVLDIGAGLGFYTLIFAKLVGKKGKVFAFEPEPENFAYLKKLIEKHGYKNVVLVNKAVSNSTGKLKLYLSPYYKGDHTLYAHKDNPDYIEVEALRLNDYFHNNNRKIDFIKMDVNGAENAVIKGMDSIIGKADKIKLFTEFWPFAFKHYGSKPEQYLELLQEQGFRLYYTDSKEKQSTLVDVDELLKRYTFEKKNYTNLLCLKGY